MPSLFQRLFPSEEVESLSVATEGLESAIVRVMRGDPDEGLIPAEDLPSAAKTLAELFPPEPAPAEYPTDTSAAFEDRYGHHDQSPTEADRTEAIVNDEESDEEFAGETERDSSAAASVPETSDNRANVEISSAGMGLDEADHEVLFAAAAEFLEEARAEDDAEASGESAGYAATDLPSGLDTRRGNAGETPGAKAPLDPAQQSSAKAPVPPRNWAFEEKLAGHHEWVETRGVTGKRGDFAGAELEATELIGVNFRFADLHDANLKDADLLLADLRDACLVRTHLEEACLVGANLEGANLEGATLETAMGLVPRQLAGANLRDASLPAQITEFSAREEFAHASRLAYRYFVASAAVTAISWLLLSKTKDIQLVTDSAVISFLHSRAAATALPTAQIYLLVPLLLFALYVVFHFNLQSLWNATLELPAVFPDGRGLADDEPAILLGLLRAHFRWINQDASSTLVAEKVVSILLAYWMVPITLLLFWARYLTIADIHGTVLHMLLAVIATGLALYATTKAGRPAERWTLERKWTDGLVEKVRSVNVTKAATWLGVALLLLSAGTFLGIPHDHSRAPQYREASMRRWVPDVLWAFGFDPYADLTEAQISTRPANWGGGDDQLGAVNGPRLNGVGLRYAQAYGAFFVNAHLLRANLQGAFLSDADLRGADLGEANLRFAILDSTRLNLANLNRANLDGADLARADLRGANLSYALLGNATLVDARLDGASLYDSQLMSATLTRASLERADVRGSSLNDAHLAHADLRQALLWSARLPGADLEGAQLGGAILIGADLRGVDFRGAQFQATVLSEADMSGANLDTADLRGAGGLTANQVCSSKSRRGALLDAMLETQVDAQCGGVLVGGQRPAASQDKAATDVAP